MSDAPPPSGAPPFIPIPPNIASITGPLLLGTLFNWALFGVLAVQVYLYAYYFSDDKRPVKLLVYGIFLLEALQTAFTGADIFYWFAAGFGNLLHLQNPYFSPFDTPFMASLATLIVQIFFAYRIYVIRKTLWWLAILIIAISFIQGIGGMVGGVRGHLGAKFSDAHKSVTYVYLWLVGDAVADLMISVTMTYLFVRSRKHDHHYSQNIMSSLMRLTVETNALSASVATVSLVLFAAAPDQAYYVCPTAIIGKIYSNTLLVTFNNRISLRDSAQKRTVGSSGFSESGAAHVADAYNARPVILTRSANSYEEPHFKTDSLGAAERASDIHMKTINAHPAPLPPKNYFNLSD